MTATSVPCPIPVLASDPYRCTCTSTTSASAPAARIRSRNSPAAIHGPIVWELLGPIPTLIISKMLIEGCVAGSPPSSRR